MKSSGPELTIRIAISRDANKISKLFREVVSPLSYYTLGAKKSEFGKYTPRGLRELLVRDKNSVLVAVNDFGELFGYAINHFEDYVIWLDWLGVRASARRHRVASLLMNGLIENARRRKCHKIWCDTRTSNLPAILLFRKMQFRKIAKVRKHWFGQDYYLWERFI